MATTENNNGISVREFARTEGVNVDTIQRRFRSRFDRWVTENSVLTEAEISALRKPKKSTERRQRKSRVSTERIKRVFDDVQTPEAIASPAADYAGKAGISLDSVRQTAFDVICISIVVGHAGLIWYDCVSRWGVPGLIGGTLAFLSVLAALLISTDATRVRTSQEALWFVLVIDVAAWWIHAPTFHEWADGIDGIVTDIFAGFLCGISFAALYLYRSSKID